MKYIFIIFIPVLLLSCMEEIDMGEIDYEEKIVVNSLFNPDSLFIVKISKSVPVCDLIHVDTGSYEARWYTEQARLHNPDVRLYDNGELVGEFSYLGAGKYSIPGFVAETGNNYEIHVASPGLSSVKACSKIPPKVHIADFNYEIVGPLLEEDIIFTRVEVTLYDPPGLENYYEIICPAPAFADHHFWTNGVLTLYTEDPVLLEAGNQSGDWESAFVFPDQSFNGEECTVVFFLRGFFYAMITSDDFMFNVELRSVSREYYEYRKKINAYNDFRFGHSSNLQQIFYAGEPVMIYTNVENGLGIFAGYSFDRITVSSNGEKLKQP